MDPLSFVDLKAYPDRINQARARLGQRDAVRTGHAYIHGRRVVLAAMDFSFLGGSMGSVVGEKIARACEAAEAGDLPFIIISGFPGGARMMESGFNLMQMAKTSAVLARFHEMGGLYISLLADPTTGGVTASFMLGDVILAEPVP